MEPFQIRPLNKNDREWVTSLLEEQWGSVRFVTRGRLFRADEDPDFAAIYPNAMEEYRKIKPEIGPAGMDGIPLRDEIELELPL